MFLFFFFFFGSKEPKVSLFEFLSFFVYNFYLIRTERLIELDTEASIDALDALKNSPTTITKICLCRTDTKNLQKKMEDGIMDGEDGWMEGMHRGDGWRVWTEEEDGGNGEDG